MDVNYRKIKKGLRRLSNLLKGFNLFVDPDKLALIKHAFNTVNKGANSFADLGGVWNVNGAYTFYTGSNFNIDKGYIVDLNFNEKVDKKLSRYKNIYKIEGNFSSPDLIERIGRVDMVYMFDVLLHQANPDWDEVLKNYSKITDCFLIFNQQYIRSEKSHLLTELPLETYKEIAPQKKEGFYDDIYARKDEINEKYNKPWISIPDIFQWGITDNDLREVMIGLGFREIFHKNCGRFSDSKHFENHAFIFINRI